MNEINLNDLNDTSELRYIYLGSNNLSNIDLSNVPNVTSLDLTDNRIQSIDLSNLHELSILELDYNFLESINLSNNPNLRTLRINNNNLSEVDFSNNPLLQDINLSNNDNIVINNLSSVSENLSGMRFDVDQYQNYNFNDFPNLNFTDTSFTVFLGEQIDITSAIKNHSIESIRYIRNNGVIDYSDGIIRTFNLGCDEIEITIENNIKMYFEVLVVNRLNVANYNIDNDNKYVFVGDDSDDEIIQAFQDSMSEDEKNNFINIYGKEYSYKVMNDKLVVYMYIDDSDILKYFSMNYRLGRIDINKARQKVQDAINDPTDEKIQEAQEAIDAQDKEETRSEKEELQNLLDGVKDSKIINQINHLLQEVRNEIIDNNLDDAQETLDQVSELVGRLIKDTNKELENNNIRALQEEIDSLNDESSKEDDAQSAVTKAERTKLQEDIEEAEELINKLKDGNKKSELTRRLTALKASLNDDQEILDEIEQRLAQVRNKIDNNKLDDAQELLNQVKNVIKTLEDEDNKNLVTNKISRLQAEINSLYERKTTLNKFDNAKTYDDIVKYFIIGGISVLLIGGVIIYTKKKK